MLRFEMYKVIYNKKMLLLIFVCIILKIIASMQMEPVDGSKFNIKIYKYYMDILDGEYSEVKAEWVDNEYQRMSQLIDEENIYEGLYKNNEITPDVYKEYIESVKSAKSRMETFDHILAKTAYYSSSDIVPDYFYDIEIRDYIKNMGIDIFLIMTMLITITSIFTEDYYSGTIKLVQSSKYGRIILFWNKFLCVLLISLILGLVFLIAEFLTKYFYFDLGDLSANIQSLEIMQASNMNMSVLDYLLITIGYRTVFTLLVGIIIMFIAQVTKKNLLSYFSVLIVVYLPYFIYEYLPKSLQDITLFQGLSAYYAFNTKHTICFLPNYIFSLFVAILVSCLLIVGTKRKFVKKL